MTALTTGGLSLPDHIIDPWLQKVQYDSVLATLAPQKPMKYGKGVAMTWNIGEAELVVEGANKAGSTANKTTMTLAPHKFQKTVRFTEEVKYADEDYQLKVIEDILTQIQPSLSRALDFGGIHGYNPATGVVDASIVAGDRIASATNVVTRPTATPPKPYLELDAADALVNAQSYVPSAVALSPAYAGLFSALRGGTTEQKLYPNFKLTTAESELDGHRSSVSRTVSAAGVYAVDPKLLAIVGDFSSFGWGVQRQLGLKMIEYGDPDGGGDLQRNNQVAFRAEVIYGWGIADLNAFALIKAQ